MTVFCARIQCNPLGYLHPNINEKSERRRDVDAIYVAILCSCIAILGNVQYIREIVKGVVTPTKSTWIIFFLVTGLNISSFLKTRFDLVGGAYSITDCVMCLVILLFTLIYAHKTKTYFKRFEKYYLIGVSLCALFWTISDNSFVTNLLVQSLIVIGYIPTIHNILASKKSSESKLAWILWALAALLSIYPALAKQNTLAIVYSLRATIMCTAILILTYRFQNNLALIKRD